MAKRYEESFKVKIIKQHQTGISAVKLCSQYGIARSTLFLWKKQYTADEAGQIPRERYLLEKELERLRTENTILKTCGCSPASPLSERLSATIYIVANSACLMPCASVNRSTYYHHAFRSPGKTQLQIRDETLKPLIAEIFSKSKARFGARKIRSKLMELGYSVSERRILRLMKEFGLSSAGSKPRLNSANDRQYHYYPNKLKRNFLTDAPNKVWVSDITYAKVGMDFLYLCVVIDLYSRKVVSYGISEHIDTALVTQAFLDAYAARRNHLDRRN